MKIENLQWTKIKPDYACVFLTREDFGRPEYTVWNFAWERGEAPDTGILAEIAADENVETFHYYLAWTTNDGDEWDCIEDCSFDEYLVLEKLPTMEQVHSLEVAMLKARYEKTMEAK